MLVMKILAGLVLPILLVGCAGTKGIYGLDVQEDCPSPGVKTNIECHYRLTIETFEANTRIATGHIPKDVIQDHYDDCIKLQTAGDIPKTYICPDPKTYPKHVYTFVVDSSSQVNANQTYNFHNRKGTGDLIVDTETMSPKQRT